MKRVISLSGIDDCIKRCDEYLSGKSEENGRDLADEIFRAYYLDFGKANIIRISYDHPDISVRQARSALAAIKERRAHELAVAQAGSMSANISANSQSSATASLQLNITQAIEVINEVSDSELSQADKEDLASMLVQMAANKKNPAKLRDKLIEALGKAGACASAIKAIIQCAGSILG